MGSCHSSVACGRGDSTARVLMIGLDTAGKTTILYRMKLKEVVTTISTIGFNVEIVTPKKGPNLDIWDVGGQEKIRPLWRHYFNNTQGVFFVVDSADRERFPVAREQLMKALNSEELRGVPVVVLANKQDLPDAATAAEVTDQLQMGDVRQQSWYVQAASGTTGDGLEEAMLMMAKMVRGSKKTYH